MLKIVQTREEYKLNLLHWEEMRKQAEAIHDSYQRVADEKFHNEYYKKIKRNEIFFQTRPEFFEPITETKNITKKK